MSSRGIKLISAGCILVATILLLCLRQTSPPKTSVGSETIQRPETSANPLGDTESHSENYHELASIPIDSAVQIPEVRLPPTNGRKTYSSVINEVQKLFGGNEAGRATLLKERLNENNTSYLYVVEPPTQGEIQTVRAQIADLRKEVLLGDIEDFDIRLENEIKSYDPFGENGRKVLLITVPLDKAARMSGSILAADDLDHLKANLESGESLSVTMRNAWFSSYDGKTLERFDQLIVWEPK